MKTISINIRMKSLLSVPSKFSPTGILHQPDFMTRHPKKLLKKKQKKKFKF